jgi:dipeptidyl aminopeptidase/acylaminoacyl peptidase
MWEKSSGRLSQISDAIVRPFNPFEVVRWTPDSRKILVKVLPESLTIEGANSLIHGPSEESGNEVSNNGATVTVYSSPAITKQSGAAKDQRDTSRASNQSDINNVYLADLALIDISNGAVQRIASAIKVRWYRISPDGSNIAFLVHKGLISNNSRQSQHDLVVVSLREARSRVLASNIQLSEWAISISWSPDGKLLSYTEGGPQAKGDCYIVPVTGGGPRKVTESPHPRFDGASRSPLWDETGQFLYLLSSNALWKVSVTSGAASEVTKIPNRKLVEVVSPAGGGRFWSPDRRSMYISTRDDETKRVGFYKIDLTTGQLTELIEENKTYGSYLVFNVDVSNDGETVIYYAQDAQHSPDLWMAGVDFKNPRRLTRINPQFDQYIMGECQLVEWESLDGQRLRGALLLPSNYEKAKRYPLIVWVYGGASGSDMVNQFGLDFGSLYNLQLLATRGFAVLFPDVPLRVGTPMQDLTKTVLPGVDKIVELGIADSQRIGVMGWSYGGYSTLALIVQTTRFKAAVMGAGLGNLFSMYGQMSKQGTSWAIAWAEEGQGRMGGSPWEFRERYIENSPIFYLDRVQTPLLIVHGTLDRGNSSYLSDEIFVGLRRLGKEVTYAKYEGEGHGILAFANQTDWCNRVIAWFDQHLKQKSQVSLANQTNP